MSSYLEQLKKLVADSFQAKEVKTKEDIDTYTSMSKAIDSAIGENQKLLEANAELSQNITDLCLHTTIGAKPIEKDVKITKEAPDINELIKQFEVKN